MHPFTGRANLWEARHFFTCEKLFLPNNKVRTELIQTRTYFYILFDNPSISLKIVDCSLFARRVSVDEPNHQYWQRNLERGPAQNNNMEARSKNFIIPSRQNHLIQETMFNKAPITRIAVAMNTNSAVANFFHKNLSIINNFI